MSGHRKTNRKARVKKPPGFARVTVTLPRETHKVGKALASEQGRPFSNYIGFLIMQAKRAADNAATFYAGETK